MPSPPRRVQSEIAAGRMSQHIRVLASDAFEGRGPGTPGEIQSVRYLVDQFKALGLKPGNPNGTYVQTVPLIEIVGQSAAAAYRLGDQRTDVPLTAEGVVWSRELAQNVAVEDADIWFVGYGVVAPEYHWDDYKGVDLRGKTLVMLVNDPPVPDPKNPQRLDPHRFGGRAMTYYGRWTYKFEIAAMKGAAAALVVHETGPAGYPWSVVVNSNSRGVFDLQSAAKTPRPARIEGWITHDRARQLFAAGGHDFEALKRSAARPDFRPVPLGSRATFQVSNTWREVKSQNVLARLDGSDPKLKREYVVYCAHWDHLGRDPSLAGDPIYHGALDNAAGVAALLELGRAFKAASPAPKRSILFLSVTAEEKGLLGARYYVEQPLYPLARTVALLNFDGLNPWGRTRDLEVIGYGQSTLEDLLRRAAAGQRRVIQPDSEPERGRFYRSDHFEFARRGVPALYIKGGMDYLGKPKDFGRQKTEDYVVHDYHKVTDNFRTDWDLTGAVEDVQLMLRVGWAAAQQTRRPAWKPGSEFKPMTAAPARSRK